MYGTALGGILADNGHDVDYYDPKHEKERLLDVVSDAKYIILCTPSEVAPHLLPHLPKHIPLVVATKGFLSTKYFDDFEKWGVLSGPGFAKKIKARKKARLTVTSEWIAELFAANFILFDIVDDKKGVLMCGALKNIYAILAGKFGLKPNTVALREYLVAALYEISQVLKANGADEKTTFFSCGIGDLTLTCSSDSRNYSFGAELRDNPNAKPKATVEGVTALHRIAKGEIKVPDSAQYLRQLVIDSEKWK